MKKHDRSQEIGLENICSFNQAILSSIPFGIDIVDEKGNILFVNQVLKGVTGKEALGKKCWELYKDDKNQCPLCPLKKEIKLGQTERIETTNVFGGKTFEVFHTGLIYENKKAIMEIFIDITDRKKLEEGLRELDRRKSDFVATVSHEFKSPLSVIKESLSIILDGIAGEINPEQKGMLEKGKKSIDRLIRLVTDLLDVSKIESGKMEIRKEMIDIGQLVNEVLKTHGKEIYKKQLILKKDIPKNIGMLLADRDKLTQVMINLFSNAIKYTPSGGNIAISLLGIKSEIRFEIFNSGPGISKEGIDKLFDKFERITAEKQEGTGLGLSISKDIIELHKGKIWVESEVGKGNKFIFTLPRDSKNNFKQHIQDDLN